MTAIHRENKALLHLRERNRAGGQRSNDRGWPGTSACGIQCIAALQDQRDEQKRAERSQEGTDSFHTGSYHALEQKPRGHTTELIRWCIALVVGTRRTRHLLVRRCLPVTLPMND